MTEVFQDFGKIPRLNRGCTITEKIDGTNAQIVVPADDTQPLLFGSRNRWITPEQDNMGFARWGTEHAEELRRLGPGRHFGEWWGLGIQRRYGIQEKRFSLFNTWRFLESGNPPPACCSVVPVLYQGPFSSEAVEGALLKLRTQGSHAAPGFMRPEGIIVYHEAAKQYFKVTLEDDEKPKGLDSTK